MSISIHDNNVYAYTVRAAERTLVLYTEYRDGGRTEFTEVVFEGVLTHYFEGVLEGNILFDIEEAPSILDQYADLFRRMRNYNWPCTFDDLGDLKVRVASAGYRPFAVSSSYGLSGFVLAQRMELIPRQARYAG